jgi:hypothetical protein
MNAAPNIKSMTRPSTLSPRFMSALPFLLFPLFSDMLCLPLPPPRLPPLFALLPAFAHVESDRTNACTSQIQHKNQSFFFSVFLFFSSVFFFFFPLCFCIPMVIEGLCICVCVSFASPHPSQDCCSGLLADRARRVAFTCAHHGYRGNVLLD